MSSCRWIRLDWGKICRGEFWYLLLETYTSDRSSEEVQFSHVCLQFKWVCINSIASATSSWKKLSSWEFFAMDTTTAIHYKKKRWIRNVFFLFIKYIKKKKETICMRTFCVRLSCFENGLKPYACTTFWRVKKGNFWEEIFCAPSMVIWNMGSMFSFFRLLFVLLRQLTLAYIPDQDVLFIQ